MKKSRKSTRKGTKWRTRVRGTKNQVGKPFILDGTSSQTKKARLPKLKGKAVVRYPTGRTVRYTVEDMPIEQLDTQTSVILDPNPENFESRVQHFVGMYNRGETIPPILFHRMKDGKIKILDGRARLEAFRRLGIPRIPAVENGILSSIKSGLSSAFKATKSGMTKLVQGTKGFSEGVKVGTGKSDKLLEPSKSVAQSVGRKAGLTATNIAKTTRKAGARAIEHGKAVYNILEGKGTTRRGMSGGGDLVMPSKKWVQTQLDNKTPIGHRPCVIEKKVKGKTLYVYGTLLDPRTNPRYMQKYGYTDVK
jgi:hypothetical protein